MGLDITFPEADALYGIPEHASSHILRNTRGQGEGSYDDPYRLYNLDVFEYEPNEPIALYGSAPILYAHDVKTGRTVGVFWLNPTETWVDVDGGSDTTASGTRRTRWTSEDGNVDLWVLPGPLAEDVARQYTAVTGRPGLPPQYATMYHQSRWNYVSENDVGEVNEHFNAIDMPVDVLWLDIEHTDGKRYFTWDTANFPTPERMQDELARDGRHLVTIVDPHIKRDSAYRVNSEASARGFFVRESAGQDPYQGECWPGSSSWVDFVSPEARAWWSELFALDSYRGSTDRLGIWNDMNEPAIFHGPEETMRKDAKHWGNLEHRQVHNMYGYLNVMATYSGLLARSNNNNGDKSNKNDKNVDNNNNNVAAVVSGSSKRLRPFILTRAFFAGSQKYAAVWTGDNAAKWSHLKASIPMALSLNIAGIVHSGADVGGFFGNPEPELLVRWYQTAAYLPFFRAHAHIETKRREPWLFEKDVTAALRSAVLHRYALLPYWSTLFYAAHANATPVARPLWSVFPRDPAALAVDDEFMLGPSILVHPVTEEKATSASVYFPDADWYDADTLKLVRAQQKKKKNGVSGEIVNVQAPLDKIPVYYRGGSIVPRKERVRRSSQMMAYDPFTLVVVLDSDGKAEGELFVDDGESFDFEDKKAFFFTRFSFADGTLAPHHTLLGYDLGWSVERVAVVGLKKAPTKVVAVENGKTSTLAFEYAKDTKVLTIKKPVDHITSDWKVVIS